ncbi:MAG: YdcH family protein [Deltaproteobacteria bacterium]|nr:YdcH family protein [Deltaproteobacteria bacterium]
MQKLMQEATDQEALLKRLRAEHRALEARLQELEKHLSLTAQEQIEWVELKKRKLAKRDQIQKLERRFVRASPD